MLAHLTRCGQCAREVRELRPSDVSAGERAVIDNLDARAREVLAAIPRTTDMLTRGRAEDLRKQIEHSLGFHRQFAQTRQVGSQDHRCE